MNRHFSASSCFWNSPLQWMRIGTAVASIALFTSGNLWAANLEKLEGSVSDIESKMNRARTQFVTNLESCVERIRRSKMDPQLKRKNIETLESEIAEFRRTNRLPDHAVLIKPSLGFAQTTAPLACKAEAIKSQIIEASMQNGADKKELRRLESRIDCVLAGATQWEKGDVWRGRRVYDNGDSQELELRIHDVAGNNYKGVLIQKYNNGTFDKMDVAGMRNGTSFTMETTGMKLGKARYLAFNGIVIGGQIFANVSGVSVSKKPANGFAGLRK